MNVHYKSRVTIFGDEFDAHRFQESLPVELKGEVGKLKNWTPDKPEGRCYFWSSHTILDKNYEVNPGERCCEILLALNDYLLPISTNPTNEIFCSIGVHYDDSESVSGFWFSTEVIHTMSKYNAQIDIDSYCYPPLE